MSTRESWRSSRRGAGWVVVSVASWGPGSIGILPVMAQTPDVASPSPASRETTDVPADGPSPASEQEEAEVVVTVRRWSDARSRYPGSSSVYSRRELQEANARTVQEATTLAPNSFMRQSNVDSTLVLRGMASYPTALHAPASVFVDEVALPASFMHDASLYDVERLEVLRGSQTALFGRNTAAGAVHLVTVAPTPAWRSRVQGELSTFLADGRGAPGTAWEIGVGGPIGQEPSAPWSFSLAGRWQFASGYMRQIGSDDHVAQLNRSNGALKLRYVDDGLDVSLSLRGVRHDDGKGYFRYATGPARTPRFSIDYDTRSTQEETGWVGAARLRYESGSLALQSLTSVVRYTREFIQDFDASALPAGASAFDFETDTLTQDLRVGSRNDAGALRWLIGAVGFLERSRPIFDLSGVPMIGVRRDTNYSTRGVAGYGQASYQPIEPVEISAALRVERQTLSGEQTFTTPMAAATYGADLNYTVLLPQASIAYGLGPARLYASVGRGFLSGGYNYNFAVNQATLTYDPEYTWSYESGVKLDAYQGRLYASAALFYLVVDDKQVAESVPGGAQRIANAARAHSAGAEVELEVRPARGLQLIASAGYDRTGYDDFETLAPNAEGQLLPVDYSDRRLIYAPEFTLGSLARYHHPSGLWASMSCTAVGRFYFDPANLLAQRQYSLLGARLGYAQGNLAGSIWVENALGTRREQFATLVQGQGLVQDAPPIEVGVRVAYELR